MKLKPKVLILCTRNSCRSQMAEGFLRDVAGDRFEIFSAGTDPQPIHPLAIQVMGEIGIDISAQPVTAIKEVLGQHTFKNVFFVCEQAHEQCPSVYPSLGEHTYWPFEDPEAFQGSEAEKLAKFREVRDRIRDRIMGWLREIGA